MSAFLRRRMRGFLRTTFSVPQSTDAICSAPASNGDHTEELEEELLMMLDHHQPSPGPSSSSSAMPIFERILNGKYSRHGQHTAPEVYSGKTGLDLPNIHVGPLHLPVKASHTGPDGGLSRVQPMRQRAIAKMAKLDDEEFSLSSMDEEEEAGQCHQMENAEIKQEASAGSARNGTQREQEKKAKKQRRMATALMRAADSMEALGFGPEDQLARGSQLERLDWANWDEQRAFGMSTSLYEKHPVTGLSAGHPIADVFGIIARENNAIFALADGVNWGDGARLAARCAIRGATDHLNGAVQRQQLHCTNDIFHSLLGAFHAAHALILQEGGALTTLCVALVAPVKQSNSSVLCVCNVGDSLCFVYNATHGVREVTLGSHDIAQMRDMRDAGGALGPVDGRNPQLHNLTCSLTFVEQGDLVFITSDGISDNFDPVVGKFCVIRRPREDSNEKENDGTTRGRGPPLPPPGVPFHKTKSAPAASANSVVSFQFPPTAPKAMPMPTLRPLKRPPAAMLPCVDALERHELMLLRMSDVIPNGLYPAASPSCSTSSTHSASSPSPASGAKHQIGAAELCRNLVQFAYQLSSAKRRTLEDPELYRTRTHSKTEERLRRKMIRNLIMEMPGKLDHASVVAYRVGSEWPSEEAHFAGEYEQRASTQLANGNGHERRRTMTSRNEAVENGIGTEQRMEGLAQENDYSDAGSDQHPGNASTKNAREEFFGKNGFVLKKDSECQAGEDVLQLSAKMPPSMECAENGGAEQEASKSKQSIAIQCSWRPPVAPRMPKTSANSISNKSGPTMMAERKGQMNLADLPIKIDKKPEISTKKPAPTKQVLLRSPYEELPLNGEDFVVAEERLDRANGADADLESGSGIGTASSRAGERQQRENGTGKKKAARHGRGSLARHTLGVDVSWLKRLVASKHSAREGEEGEGTNKIDEAGEEAANEQEAEETKSRKISENTTSSNEGSGSPRCSHKKRAASTNLRSMLGTVPAISSSALNNVGEKLWTQRNATSRRIRAAFMRQSSSQDSRRAQNGTEGMCQNGHQIEKTTTMAQGQRERAALAQPLPVLTKIPSHTSMATSSDSSGQCHEAGKVAPNLQPISNGGAMHHQPQPRMGIGQLKNAIGKAPMAKMRDCGQNEGKNEEEEEEKCATIKSIGNVDEQQQQQRYTPQSARL